MMGAQGLLEPASLTMVVSVSIRLTMALPSFEIACHCQCHWVELLPPTNTTSEMWDLLWPGSLSTRAAYCQRSSSVRAGAGCRLNHDKEQFPQHVLKVLENDYNDIARNVSSNHHMQDISDPPQYGRTWVDVRKKNKTNVNNNDNNSSSNNNGDNWGTGAQFPHCFQNHRQCHWHWQCRHWEQRWKMFFTLEDAQCQWEHVPFRMSAVSDPVCTMISICSTNVANNYWNFKCCRRHCQWLWHWCYQ